MISAHRIRAAKQEAAANGSSELVRVFELALDGDEEAEALAARLIERADEALEDEYDF